MTDRSLDAVCLGRAAVDLYGQQVGGRLEDMQSFAKYLGGSSGNLAAGLAKLGVRSGMLTRVGDEAMGRFVREELARQGVDVSRVITDPRRLTGLVVLGIGDSEDIPHIFFRERCADMGLVAEDIDEAYLADSRVLAVTGTHLSTGTTRQAVARAVEVAVRHGVRVVLDIDYRPVLWGVVGAGDGASRFAESAEVTRALQDLLPHCDLVVGTEEEIAIAGGATDVLEALRAVRERTSAPIVLKRGPAGCTVFDTGPITGLAAGLDVPGFPVEVFNTLGAGDAFLAGFLSAWIAGESWQRCGETGNACGALVVARHGCTPAMPSREELAEFLRREDKPRQPRRDDRLNHLHRSATWRDEPGPMCVLAFDHRSQFEALAAESGRDADAVSGFKSIIGEALLDAVADGGGAGVRHGAIVDGRYGQATLARLSRAGLWTASPVEVPGSRPLEFDPHVALGQTLHAWPAGRVVKCLVYYHPDDPAELRHAQEERLRALYAEVVALERRLMLEVICPEERPLGNDTLARGLRRLYNLGVRPDWWKLAAQPAAGWEAVSAVIDDCDPHCKGVVLLGQGADEATLREALTVAAGFDACRGFAVGRSIFAEPARRWFAGAADDGEARDEIRRRYLAIIDVWCRAADRRSSVA